MHNFSHCQSYPAFTIRSKFIWAFPERCYPQEECGAKLRGGNSLTGTSLSSDAISLQQPCRGSLCSLPRVRYKLRCSPCSIQGSHSSGVHQENLSACLDQHCANPHWGNTQPLSLG